MRCLTAIMRHPSSQSPQDKKQPKEDKKESAVSRGVLVLGTPLMLSLLLRRGECWSFARRLSSSEQQTNRGNKTHLWGSPVGGKPILRPRARLLIRKRQRRKPRPSRRRRGCKPALLASGSGRRTVETVQATQGTNASMTDKFGPSETAGTLPHPDGMYGSGAIQIGCWTEFVLEGRRTFNLPKPNSKPRVSTPL